MTATSRHICYLLDIGEGKFCFSLPEDLTVKDYFCIFLVVPCLYFCREIQEATARSCACARHETAHHPSWRSFVSISFVNKYWTSFHRSACNRKILPF